MTSKWGNVERLARCLAFRPANGYTGSMPAARTATVLGSAAMPLIGHEIYRLPECPTCGAPVGAPCLPTCPAGADEPDVFDADIYGDEPWDGGAS